MRGQDNEPRVLGHAREQPERRAACRAHRAGPVRVAWRNEPARPFPCDVDGVPGGGSRSWRAPHAARGDRAVRRESWWVIVWLSVAAGRRPRSRQARRLLAAGSVTLAKLRARDPRAGITHLHCFELGDGSRHILGGHDELDPSAADSQTIAPQRAGLARIGVTFTYTFDLGDDWTQRLRGL